MNKINPSFPEFPATQREKWYFTAFPISYRVESGFSWVIYLPENVRNRFDVVKGGNLH